MKNKKQIKILKLLFMIKNFCYINLSLLFLNLIYSSIFLLSLKFQQGFLFYCLFALQGGYFIFGLYKYIFYQCNTFKLMRLVGDCPLSIIVGKLFKTTYNFFTQTFEIGKFNLDFYIVITNTFLLIVFMKFIRIF